MSTNQDAYKYRIRYALEKAGYGNKKVKYKIFIRSKPFDFCDLFKDEFSKILNEYQRSFISKGILEPNSNFKNWTGSKNTPEIKFEVVKGNLLLEYEGLWKNEILHEIPLLRLIHEIYYKLYDPTPVKGYYELVEKYWRECNHPIVEMGTRRAISPLHQKQGLLALKNIGKLEGTSNIDLGLNQNIPIFGSTAHEFFMALGNKTALDEWLKAGFSYNLTLPDTFTTKKFLEDFDYNFALKYDGIRQDSGDPYEFTELMLDHYSKLKIDSLTKDIVYSDDITPKLANNLHNKYDRFFRKVTCASGSNVAALRENRLSAVIKMVEFDGKPVFKKSDDPRKSTC